MTGQVYSVKNHILRQSTIRGGEMAAEGCIVKQAESEGFEVILRPFDGIETDADWGRFAFEYDLYENQTLVVHAMALNHQISVTELNDFRRDEAISLIGHKDILLYSLKGRYLYLAVQIKGEGPAEIRKMRVDKQGDNFMNTFPEIYRDRNSFFHRYISIFSSMYNDFQEDIDSLPDMLDLDTCPVNLLPMYGKWMGIDINCDFKDERIMRDLVKEAYNLNRLKGTKKVILRIIEIILGEEAIILEKNIIDEFLDDEYKESYRKLFGNNVYNVCILLNSPVSEVVKSQLMYMIEQYIPMRARIQITNLMQEGDLDNHSYLDINAKLFEISTGELDESMGLDQSVTLL